MVEPASPVAPRIRHIDKSTTGRITGLSAWRPPGGQLCACDVSTSQSDSDVLAHPRHDVLVLQEQQLLVLQEQQLLQLQDELQSAPISAPTSVTSSISNDTASSSSTSSRRIDIAFTSFPYWIHPMCLLGVQGHLTGSSGFCDLRANGNLTRKSGRKAHSRGP